MSTRRLLAPLALAQFICSFAGSNMNVMINDITEDLDTTVTGVQATITLFLLVMAVLMIPCSKLTDRWGRKRCFILGLALYGVGALLSAIAPGLGVLILGNSILEGVGTAFLIPPVYILTTLAFSDLTSRARAFGVISGMGGIGAAAGPLIGGVITSAISWRAAFMFQALVIVTIILLARRIADPVPADPTRPFDPRGTAAPRPAQEAGERGAGPAAGDDAERSARRVAAILDRGARAAHALVGDRVHRLGERQVDVPQPRGRLLDVVAHLGGGRERHRLPCHRRG